MLKKRNFLKDLIKSISIKNNSTSINNNSNLIKNYEAIPGPKPIFLIGNLWRYLPIIGDYSLDTLHLNAFKNQSKYGDLVR